jgi:glycosyltransferase involved in cell wall biosynthesis
VTVSIILTTYNRTELLMTRAIPSVLAQTDPDWECHVIGDGTEEATADAMADLIARDGRFRFTNLPHAVYPDFDGDRYMVLGYASLNHGLDTATGEFITTLADDDAYRPNHNAVLLSAINSTGADFAYGVSDYHWNHGRFQQAGHWPPGMGSFCDGAWLCRNGLPYRYDPDSIYRGLPIDGDMWTRMFADGVKFTFVSTTVLDYYVGRQ